MGLGWMAWTWQTALVFIFVFGSIAFMGVLEMRNPGGNPRDGILGLRTTRGDRLFLSMLGSAYLFLAWLGIMGTPLWGLIPLVVLWFVFVFRKV
jgi:predicted small integral membrane protein